MGQDVGAVESRAYAATWRSEDGQVVATTWAGTMCRAPRRPGGLRIEHEGYQHILPCGECEGCLQLEQLRLQDRLRAHYHPSGFNLWLVRVSVDQARQVSLRHKLHRNPALALEPAFFLFGPNAIGFLARKAEPVQKALRKFGLRGYATAIRKRGRRRAWRCVTRGLSVEREVYGANTNRWYARGLPPAEKQTWALVKIRYQKGYQRASSPRAWKANGQVLFPPEIFAKRLEDKRAAAQRAPRSDVSESTRRILDRIYGSSTKPAQQSSLTTAPQERPTKELVVEWYAAQERTKAASASSSIPPQTPPTPSEEGGYKTSIHTNNPKLISDSSEEELLAPGAAGDDNWMERERERNRLEPQRRDERNAKILAESLAIIERMAAKQKERDKGG